MLLTEDDADSADDEDANQGVIVVSVDGIVFSPCAATWCHCHLMDDTIWGWKYLEEKRKFIFDFLSQLSPYS